MQNENLEILDDLEALQRDPATAELIRSGRTIGCFYIESPSMRSLFHRMRCECYEDVVAASSIIRPGVAESGMMNEYVERRRAMLVERIEIEFVNEHAFLVVHLAVVGDHDPAAKPAGRRLEPQVIPNAAAKQAGAINLVLICIIIPRLGKFGVQTSSWPLWLLDSKSKKTK